MRIATDWAAYNIADFSIQIPGSFQVPTLIILYPDHGQLHPDIRQDKKITMTL